MYSAVFTITLLFYLIGTACYLLLMVFGRAVLGRLGTYSLAAGFFSHCATLITRYIAGGHIPVVNLHESLSFFAWALIAFFLLLNRHYEIRIVGSLVAPFASVLVLWAAALPKEILPLHPSLQSVWLPFHVIFAFLGDAIFALACVAGVVYLIQERLVKSKRVAGMSQRLPSLDVLDAINARALTIGFPLLTLGIMTGAAWAASAWGSYWSWDPKETWSLITWLLYAALLHQRLMVGWRGKKAAIMSIVAFGALLFTFLGVNLLMKGLHSYSQWSSTL